jgi:hypothetical protein
MDVSVMVRDTVSPAKKEQVPSARLNAMQGSSILAETMAAPPSSGEMA